jgi:hypothetical protein
MVSITINNENTAKEFSYSLENLEVDYDMYMNAPVYLFEVEADKSLVENLLKSAPKNTYTID